MQLAHLLLKQALAQGDAPAVFRGTVLHARYAEWAARSAAGARRLRAAGLEPGDRVLLFMRNHPRYLSCFGPRGGPGWWWCRSTPSCIQRRWPGSPTTRRPAGLSSAPM